jgi:hypothetical protein
VDGCQVPGVLCGHIFHRDRKTGVGI